MTTQSQPVLAAIDVDAVLRRILAGTAGETGKPFFAALVKNLAEALHVRGAWVTEYLPKDQKLRALALWWDNQWIANYEYKLGGTPCEPVIKEKRCFHVANHIVDLFPGDNDLAAYGAVSYLGAPLIDTDGQVLGNLCVLDTRPMPEQPHLFALFKIFAAQAAAEHRRLRVEARLREREDKLARLVDSAMDAIIELDGDLNVTLWNPAAAKMFECTAARAVGHPFRRFLTAEGDSKLTELLAKLNALPTGHRHLWIPRGLRAVSTTGDEFPAEASLARSNRPGPAHYTLIVRNVNDRVEAERKINSLTAETEYLREEIRNLALFGEFIGQSDALLHVLRDVQQVAGTDTTVLILGETGTGKELVARAIHSGSTRRNKPLIKVNCSAIPAALMESEFFGHEKGAFTGATTHREGRFALADGGTIFLDEIGDLSLDLQAKLLRVLQEGEFEPVGSSRTRRVNVRIIAATNRDLGRAVMEGKFRQDLYYRINVFPLSLPPLRDRGDDVVLLAEAFTQRFAKRLGRTIEPLSPESAWRLKHYDWPGNVRELQNVIERAVITSQNGRLNIERAFPIDAPPPASSREETADTILTITELRALEKQNLKRALDACDWKVAGQDGAATLLGMKPSTLNSRLKALGIARV